MPKSEMKYLTPLNPWRINSVILFARRQSQSIFQPLHPSSLVLPRLSIISSIVYLTLIRAIKNHQIIPISLFTGKWSDGRMRPSEEMSTADNSSRPQYNTPPSTVMNVWGNSLHHHSMHDYLNASRCGTLVLKLWKNSVELKSQKVEWIFC